jgi:formylglycine-generating enzyme required for sulfatase activity
MSLNLGLAPGATLRQGTYRIERVLGQGGFGITYLATDLSLERLVAVKEFFPKDFCDRDASTSHVTLGTKGSEEFILKMKTKFLKEARNIAKLNHPGIIKIHAAFEENNTAYYVMEYIDGGSLSEKVKSGGPLSEVKALEYIRKIGQALEYVHARKINHLDVKPANVMVRQEDDEPVLIDFGLSKQYDSEGNQTSTTPTGISHGYAPIEQYNAGGVKEFSPQADVYSLGATLYYLLSGVVPPQATMLIADSLTFPQIISPYLVSVISKAMSPNKNARYATVQAFLEDLSATSSKRNVDMGEEKQDSDESTKINEGAQKKEEPSVQPEPVKVPTLKTQRYVLRPQPQPKKNLVGILIGVLAVIALVVIVLVSKIGGSNQTAGVNSDGRNDVSVQVADGTSYTVSGVTFEMIDVEGGNFNMGGNDSEAYDYEKPVHSEYVSSFQIGKTEVTQALWKAVMGNNPSYFKGDNLPVENVSWNDCKDFIRKLNSMTGKNFRLPTEAEWEYAARGGNRSRGYKYSGSNSIGEVAWYGNNSSNTTHAVATKAPNELGIYDMSGNVWEWTSDLWSDNYNSSRSGSRRVSRGGSWINDARFCRVSCRGYGGPTLSFSSLGFRLAL